MDVKKYLDLKERLTKTLGEERVNGIIDEIKEVASENNLSHTPSILEDLFEYARLSIAISQI